MHSSLPSMIDEFHGDVLPDVAARLVGGAPHILPLPRRVIGGAPHILPLPRRVKRNLRLLCSRLTFGSNSIILPLSSSGSASRGHFGCESCSRSPR